MVQWPVHIYTELIAFCFILLKKYILLYLFSVFVFSLLENAWHHVQFIVLKIPQAFRAHENCIFSLLYFPKPLSWKVLEKSSCFLFLHRSSTNKIPYLFFFQSFSRGKMNWVSPPLISCCLFCPCSPRPREAVELTLRQSVSTAAWEETKQRSLCSLEAAREYGLHRADKRRFGRFRIRSWATVDGRRQRCRAGKWRAPRGRADGMPRMKVPGRGGGILEHSSARRRRRCWGRCLKVLLVGTVRTPWKAASRGASTGSTAAVCPCAPLYGLPLPLGQSYWADWSATCGKMSQVEGRLLTHAACRPQLQPSSNLTSR